MTKIITAVAWHNREQRAAFLQAWGLDPDAPAPHDLALVQDETRAGCAVTKNRAIREAVQRGADIVVVLDDDCYPDTPGMSLEEFGEHHARALEPQQVQGFLAVTDPPSRGTPFLTTTVERRVAASMGFWTHIGDYDAARQLAFGATHPMTFVRRPVFGEFFPFCGMNYAFRVKELPWAHVMERAGRWDDIWAGWIWQRAAYEVGACFNLAGPLVRHARQSNVWGNLREEVRHYEVNETLWRDIATARFSDYDTLVKLVRFRTGTE